MRLSPLSVAIKQVLKRPFLEKEKALYLHNEMELQKHFIRSARRFGRTTHTLKEVKGLKEKRTITCSTLGASRHLLGERNASLF